MFPNSSVMTIEPTNGMKLTVPLMIKLQFENYGMYDVTSLMVLLLKKLTIDFRMKKSNSPYSGKIIPISRNVDLAICLHACYVRNSCRIKS